MDKEAIQNIHKMKDEFSISKLEQEIKKRIKNAANALLNDDKKTALENLEWVDTSNKVIDQYKKKPNKIKLSIIIGLASVILIGLGLTIKLPRTNFSLDVMTKSVTLKLNKEWTINNRFSVSELNINNLKEVNAAGANIKITNEQPFNIDIQGSKIAMDNITLSANSEVTIQVKNNDQDFVIKHDSLDMDLQISKARLNINDGQLDTMVNYEIPEIFNIKSFPSVAMPINIAFADTASWLFRDMPISEINFLEESSPGSGKFNSSILSGTIKILETDKKYPLEEGDWLSLEHLETRRIQMSKSKNLIKIHIEGEVAEASAGAELFEHKLNPSIVEYLYYAKSFAFFWSCIIFMWSLIWSIKNSIFSKSENN
jgi:hypothetical protein